VEEIKENGWDLNLGRYLKGEVAETVDVESALVALEEARQALAEAEAAMLDRLRGAGYA
jgi:type I restriction enzyme M protein